MKSFLAQQRSSTGKCAVSYREFCSIKAIVNMIWNFCHVPIPVQLSSALFRNNMTSEIAAGVVAACSVLMFSNKNNV